MGQTTNVFATYPSRTDTERALGRLVELGIPRDRISVVARGDLLEDDEDGEDPGFVGRSAAAGAVGGAMGGVLATLGLAAVPGVGWLLAAGPAATLLAASLAGGAAGGGLATALASLGVDERSAISLQQALEQGGMLVVVEPPPGLGGDVMTALQLPVRPTPTEPLLPETMALSDASGRGTDDGTHGRPTTADIHG